MAEPHSSTSEDRRIDEAALESFPASDAPSWTTARAGSPPHPPWTLERGSELRASLRGDLERMMTAGNREGAPTKAALEEAVVRSMLDAGKAIVREPVDETLCVRNVECELIGEARDAPLVVVGAPYDDPEPSGVLVELALVRALAQRRFHRSLRFVAFATPAGRERYLERLRRDGRTVHVMLYLARMNLARGRGSVVFLGDLRSRAFVRRARDAFRASSRISSRAFALPSWMLPVAASDQASFARQDSPAILVTDRAPWPRRRHPSTPPDIDQMAAAVPGLVAVASRLAGMRG